MTYAESLSYLDTCAEKARAVLDSLNVPYKKETPVDIGTFKSKYGVCKSTHMWGAWSSTIEIANWFLDSKVTDSIVNTIIHEYLHTIDPRSHHGGAWKKWANYVTNNSEYTITRCTDYKDAGITEENIDTTLNPKYTCTCDACGNTFYYQRASKFIKKGGKGYKCAKCGGDKFTIVAR